MIARRCLFPGLTCAVLAGVSNLAAESLITNGPPLRLPERGAYELRILSPTMLELGLVNSKAQGAARVDSWDIVSGNLLNPPLVASFAVAVDGEPYPVDSVGFKRRPLYAPLAKRDLRIDNHLFLTLARPINTNRPSQKVEVRDLTGALIPRSLVLGTSTDPVRYSPAIHVNQLGYVPSLPKKAMIGYYLGSMGEMRVPAGSGFQIVDAKTGTVVYQGPLSPRPDYGYQYTPKPYQAVLQADFSSFTTPGEYKLAVPGLGASYSFVIDEGVAMAFARSYALGLYHQRCGTSNALPYTRHTHGPCHAKRAWVPSIWLKNTQDFLSLVSADYTNNPRHTAPRLSNVDASLYPFVRRSSVDVSGGHHDAGDYSKYTINSAALVHYLVFAADAFPGVGALDNLGLPESGDGKSDLLQEAKWEADFLAKMQDTDGGFYFLVYPRDRRYEFDVLPDHGDPQVVWPKNTAATAAAVAALAQCASSPRFKQQFPEAAARYLEQARLGWQFLTNAIARFGRDGAYQKLTHYGNDYLHDDEMAWAACELFLATGDPYYHQQLKAWFPNPNDLATRRWGWWRLWVSYGCAMRSYAFAARTGRLASGQLDAPYLARCETEIRGCANDHMTFARSNAYGTSFPLETKRVRGAGWYFSNERAFDLTVGYQLEPRADWLDAILSNLNYEGGCNPVNVCFVTGLGWKRQREMVHQYAQNDRRVLPPSGLPLGNIQSTCDYLWTYGGDLGALCFPSDGATVAPYPYYDRWADSFIVSTEFVVTDQARSLASMAWLAAQTPLAIQAWRSTAARITGLPAMIMTNTLLTATLEAPDLDLTTAQIVWEAQDQEPAFGARFSFRPPYYGPQWVEAEAVWPDGRRVFARGEFFATNTLPTVSVVATTPDTWEEVPTPGEFTILRSGYTNTDLRVNYQFSGSAEKFTDYRRPQGDMPEFVIIPKGSFSALLSIVPVNDDVFEGFETATLTISSNATYNVGAPGAPDRATVTIADNEFGLLGVTVSPTGDATVTWVSLPGRRYRVSGAESYHDPNWRDLSDTIVATDRTTAWVDARSGSRPHRYYRVREEP